MTAQFLPTVIEPRNHPSVIVGVPLPALFAPDPATAKRVLEFFTANIRNSNTRKAYAKAAGNFAIWCEAKGLDHLRDVQPVHVAAYIEELQQRIAVPSVKLQLAASACSSTGLSSARSCPPTPRAWFVGRSM